MTSSPISLVAGMGRLGTEVARGLLRAGHRVYGINRSGRCLQEGIVMVAADLTEPLSMSVCKQLPKADNVVVALAPSRQHPGDYEKTYRGGMDHLVVGLGGQVSRLLYVSSTVVYSQNLGEWVSEDSVVTPHNLRATVQLQCEQMAAAAANTSVVLRLGGLYGPGREALLNRVRAKTPVTSKPAHFTNRVFQTDAANMVVHLLQNSDSQGVFLGVDNQPAPMHEVCQWLAERMGMDPLPQLAQSSDVAVSGKRISNQRLLNSGFQCRYPSFKEGYSALLGSG